MFVQPLGDVVSPDPVVESLGGFSFEAEAGVAQDDFEVQVGGRTAEDDIPNTCSCFFFRIVHAHASDMVMPYGAKKLAPGKLVVERVRVERVDFEGRRMDVAIDTQLADGTLPCFFQQRPDNGRSINISCLVRFCKINVFIWI